MRTTDLLADAFDRVKGTVHSSVLGLSAEELAFRVDDDGWDPRFDLPFPAEETGYGHEADQVAAVRVPSGDLLAGYHDAVHERTLRYLRTLSDADLERVVY